MSFFSVHSSIEMFCHFLGRCWCCHYNSFTGNRAYRHAWTRAVTCAIFYWRSSYGRVCTCQWWNTLSAKACPCVCVRRSVSNPKESIAGMNALMVYSGEPGIGASCVTWPLKESIVNFVRTATALNQLLHEAVIYSQYKRVLWVMLLCVRESLQRQQ